MYEAIGVPPVNHSQACVDLVASFEGCSFVAYQDGNGVWTIGYGHTQGVDAGDTCTRQQASDWLSEDLEVADHALQRLVKIPINQNQWDGLTSFVFNIGQGNFAQSTCLRDLNANNIQGAADAILMWDRVAGQVSSGLVRRRTAERSLFLTEVAS